MWQGTEHQSRPHKASRQPFWKNLTLEVQPNPRGRVVWLNTLSFDPKGLTMLISTLALAMSIAMMVSAIVILYNETLARKQPPSFE